ncbi:MAG: hypothetical protein Q7K42_02560, partial [Candidatus Diapherotrites archaeon]|nr:hypothetical protein [Candidatus Diapherotrites archaeon]
MTRTEFHTKAHLYLCILIAFFLPVYINVVPALIALLTVNWAAEGNFQEKIVLLKKNKNAWLFIAFYLIHIIGMLWTENTSAGWFDLQVKLSLLLFPLIMSTTSSETKKNLWSFVFGCVLAGIICIVIATMHYFKTGENHFEYTFLSYDLHPTYFAMYIDFAIAILIYSINNYNSKKEKAVRLMAVL